MRIIDTHAHFDDEAFDGDRDILLSEGLSEAGVELVVNMGASMEGAMMSAELAARYPMVYAGCGVHPDEVGVLEAAQSARKDGALSGTACFGLCSNETGVREDLTGEDAAGPDIQALLQSPGILRLRQLLARPKVVCVGEIGLDYHWMVQPKEIQQRWFAAQLHLATELGLPINVHSREAAQDTFDIIVKHHTVAGPSEADFASAGGSTADHRGGGIAAGGNTAGSHGRRSTTGGIIHCYSGSPEMAEDYVRLGYHIGVGGVVTFKNSKRLRKVVERIPAESIVTETDCPYMAPEPVRGSRNDSRNIRYVIGKIAEIKGMDMEECAEILRKNALEVYRIEE